MFLSALAWSICKEAPMLRYIDVGNINGKNFEGSTGIQSLTQHKFGDGVGVFEYRFVVFGGTDGGDNTFAYTGQYGVFTGTTH